LNEFIPIDTVLPPLEPARRLSSRLDVWSSLDIVSATKKFISDPEKKLPRLNVLAGPLYVPMRKLS
jgi:hypothetical protein